MYEFSYFPFGFEDRIWDLIVSVPDDCLSFYFLSIRMYFGHSWYGYDIFCLVNVPLLPLLWCLEGLFLTVCHSRKVRLSVWRQLRKGGLSKMADAHLKICSKS